MIDIDQESRKREEERASIKKSTNKAHQEFLLYQMEQKNKKKEQETAESAAEMCTIMQSIEENDRRVDDYIHKTRSQLHLRNIPMKGIMDNKALTRQGRSQASR